MKGQTVAVGTDGSQWGEAALHWAARHAWNRGAELLVLCGAQRPPARPITRDFPLLPMRILVTTDAPLAAFTEASRESELLVLGCRGDRHRHLGIGALVLPTILTAQCDTVIVRGADAAVDGRHRRVTAMVSGGQDDPVVVTHAAEAALTLRADLLVLHAKPEPLTHRPISPERDPDSVLAAAEKATTGLGRRPETAFELVRTHPHEVIAARADTDLLVVGHGRSGAVTRTALHLAPCPVLVVREDTSPREVPPASRLTTRTPCLPWPSDDRLSIHLERITTGGT
ncbi:universal stress protein [Kutzneria sp. CA-103260]|uniref:universal stress protein n=1 Tax=Kutzneria sp. CA-103260 TaxID=2802641 RepID=UPI001BA7992A|nr:universal stress protein [Kutzneria sp. CA-103260]QUQ64096.1 universal stress protein [Kutzneria sp. CA-103260]